MTVGELIEELSKHDAAKEVGVYDEDLRCWYRVETVEAVSEAKVKYYSGGPCIGLDHRYSELGEDRSRMRDEVS